VSTLNAEGKVNVAPFSAFMSVSAINNLLAISVNERAGGTKDTVDNIRARGEFVINTVPEALAQQVQLCSEHFPSDVSEVEQAGLTVVPSTAIATPRIKETPIQFECKVHSMLPFETAQLIVGRVVVMHARAGLVNDYKVAIDRYLPLGRLAGRTYCRIGDLVHA
jgi:flavin reductase (DIM6/NTAB) family NADH-FMN oxidoreductase RutF